MARFHNGDLILRGSNASHEIQIKSIADELFAIESLDDSTRINGGAGPILSSGVIDDVSIDLGGGDNVLKLTGISIQDDVSIRASYGENTIQVAGIEVGEDLTISARGHSRVYSSITASNLS